MTTSQSTISLARFAQLTTGHPGFADECIEARVWDSERRDSPFSTVHDASDESYCESCDSDVDYRNGHPGVCGCEALS